MFIPRHTVRWSLVLALALPALALAQSGSHPAASTSEPTIDDIYRAAQGGQLAQADTLIARVLSAHPDSGKAHFVHAELLAKEGHLSSARAEYEKANALAPGLPFAKPQAVAGLLQRIDVSTPAPAAGAVRTTYPDATRATERASPSTGFGLPAKIGLVAMLGMAAAWVFRRRSAPVAAAGQAGAGGGTGFAAPAPGASAYAPTPNGYAPAGYPQAGYAPTGYAPTGYAPPGYAPAPQAAATPGSGLGGALMTGAAMGLGAVAVEEAVRHFSHRDDRTETVVVNDRQFPAFGERLGPDTNADMGGNDFGISDTGSWDGNGDGASSDDNGW